MLLKLLIAIGCIIALMMFGEVSLDTAKHLATLSNATLSGSPRA